MDHSIAIGYLEKELVCLKENNESKEYDKDIIALEQAIQSLRPLPTYYGVFVKGDPNSKGYIEWFCEFGSYDYSSCETEKLDLIENGGLTGKDVLIHTVPLEDVEIDFERALDITVQELEQESNK